MAASSALPSSSSLASTCSSSCRRIATAGKGGDFQQQIIRRLEGQPPAWGVAHAERERAMAAELAKRQPGTGGGAHGKEDLQPLLQVLDANESRGAAGDGRVSRSVAAVTMPSVPSAPMKSCFKS